MNRMGIYPAADEPCSASPSFSQPRVDGGEESIDRVHACLLAEISPVHECGIVGRWGSGLPLMSGA